MAFDYNYRSVADTTATVFNAVTHTGFTVVQWCFVQMNGAFGGAGYNYGLHPCQMFSYANNSQYYYYDEFRVGCSTGPVIKDAYTIPIAFTTNTIDFDTGDRKTMNRLRLTMRTPIVDGSEAQPEPLPTLNNAGMSLVCSVFKDRKADALGSGTTADITYTHNMQTLIDNPSFNWSNLGTFRKIKFMLECNSYIPLQFQYLEANVRVAAH
jgi:hypothetical protein